MKRPKYVVLLLLITAFLTSCNKSNVPKEYGALDPGENVSVQSGNAAVELDYRFADREEGISLLLGNTDYYNNYGQNDIDYRMQKKGATVDECKEMAKEQVLDFSEEEKEGVGRSMGRIKAALSENGYSLPPLDEIVFVKTTMKEENYAGAYTHKNQIYLGEQVLEDMVSDNAELQYFCDYLMCHEIFHCLTRNNPQFREDMYGIINFSVCPKDFEIKPDIRDKYISNPDVERHNSYATFTVNGEKKDCFALLITTKPFEKPGDNFFDHITTGLVPIDDPDTLYTMDDVEDFWDVFGRNTDYVIDPEECLADNFGYAVVLGQTGVEDQPFENPEIIVSIQEYLKK